MTTVDRLVCEAVDDAVKQRHRAATSVESFPQEGAGGESSSQEGSAGEHSEAHTGAT